MGGDGLLCCLFRVRNYWGLYSGRMDSCFALNPCYTNCVASTVTITTARRVRVRGSVVRTFAAALAG